MLNPYLTITLAAGVLSLFAVPVDALEYNPHPVVIIKSLPSLNDFREQDQESLLADTIHATELRGNTEQIDVYLLFSGTLKGDPVAIFYFEDGTDELHEDADPPTDQFIMHFKPSEDAEVEYEITTHRNGHSCVQSIPPIDPTIERDCGSGAVTTKQTENGWAAYVRFFVDFERPTVDSPYYIQWSYVDAEGMDAEGNYKSETTLWPDSWFFQGTAYPWQEEDFSVDVNYGRIEINDFLHMPSQFLTENLSQNTLKCADDTIDVAANIPEDGYTKDDVARITAKIHSLQSNVKVFLTIYDHQHNAVLKKSTTYAGSDPVFLVDLDSFSQGIYTAAVEFGINGPKDSILFGVDTAEQIIQIEPNQCSLYLLFDEDKESLTVFGHIYDPSDSYLDGLNVFVDRNGDGLTELAGDDIRLYINKNDFGGKEITASGGWLDDEFLPIGDARINKLRDGYEIFAEIRGVSKDFRIATEQSDNTFHEFKKNRFPPSSFATSPQTWAAADFVDRSPVKYASSDWIPAEVLATQPVDVNLILVGDKWTEEQKGDISSRLYGETTPIIVSELHLAGDRYLYQYDFVSAPDEFSAGLFSLMREESEPVNPFYGEDDYDEPWGLASWVKAKHPEWTSRAQERFEVSYRLVDAQKVEEYIHANLVSQDPSLNSPNSANLVFISGDMGTVDFLHNYKVHTVDPATGKHHKAVGMMGYGGKYNTYFFDLYAAPWDDYQGLPRFYDENLINEYTNFHDIAGEEGRNQLFANYINHATSLLITPSYVYPPVYKTNYLIDLVVVTEPNSSANTTLIDHFIDREKIFTELSELVPDSSWDLNFSLERVTSRDLGSGVKDLLNSAEKVPVFSEEFGPIISVLDTKAVTRELVSWASTRESSNFKDFRDVSNSRWTIPVLAVIGERDNQWHVEEHGTVGLAAAHPEDANQPCCAIVLSNDKTVWSDGYGLSDLVIHEVGHVLGLMHPYQGFMPEKEFLRNDYFNWNGGAMAYSSPLHGCSHWYSFYHDEPCGIADTHFTQFEKNTISRGIAIHLIEAAENNVYRTLLDLERGGTSPYDLPPDVESQVDGITSEIKRAKDAFRLNLLHGSDGAILLAKTAAQDSQLLASEYGAEYKQAGAGAAKISIPEWIKSQAVWWVEGAIGDSEFINSIQYLIKERIIVIPLADSSAQAGPKDIPEWVKKTVYWWSTGTVSDRELADALQFLIREGVIQLGYL